MATISRRGNLQWQAKIRRAGHKQVSKTFETRKDAEAWARAVEREMDIGAFVPQDGSEKLTLGEAIARYREEKIPALADFVRETDRSSALEKREISKLFLNAVRVKDIADFIKEREAEGVGPNTIRLDLAQLSRVFEVARSWGMENLGNPVRRVERPKLPPGRSRRLEEGEEKKLLEVCRQDFQPVVLFAIETAMRRAEIASMTWDNVDLKKRFVHLPKTKNGEARSVPLAPAALDILRGLTPGNVTPISGSVFGLEKDQITGLMKRSVKKAGLTNLRFHDLRHEATSRFFENTDLDVMEIKSITGHKSMQMLARYSHLRTHRLADRLAGGRRGGQGMQV